MKRTIYTCDICGTQIPDDVSPVEFAIPDAVFTSLGERGVSAAATMFHVCRDHDVQDVARSINEAYEGFNVNVRYWWGRTLNEIVERHKREAKGRMTIGGEDISMGDSVECWIDGEIERGTIVWIEGDVITVRVWGVLGSDKLREVERKHVIV